VESSRAPRRETRDLAGRQSRPRGLRGPDLIASALARQSSNAQMRSSRTRCPKEGSRASRRETRDSAGSRSPDLEASEVPDLIAFARRSSNAQMRSSRAQSETRVSGSRSRSETRTPEAGSGPRPEGARWSISPGEGRKGRKILHVLLSARLSFRGTRPFRWGLYAVSSRETLPLATRLSGGAYVLLGACRYSLWSDPADGAASRRDPRTGFLSRSPAPESPTREVDWRSTRRPTSVGRA